MAMSKATGKPKGKAQAASADLSERIISGGARLNIETIGDFSRTVQQALTEAETVVVDFTETVEVDITALQVFCSACLTAAAMEKKFIHRTTLPQALVDLAAAAGSERREQCKNNNNACFRKFGGLV